MNETLISDKDYELVKLIWNIQEMGYRGDGIREQLKLSAYQVGNDPAKVIARAEALSKTLRRHTT